jgi:hypothetical protein
VARKINLGKATRRLIWQAMTRAEIVERGGSNASTLVV